VATPALWTFNFVAQDNRGFRARIRIPAFVGDITVDATKVQDVAAHAASVGTALAAMTNAKIVRTGFAFDFDIAQEPASETGQYQLVQDKAILTFGDGTVLKEHVFIPAPADVIFLTTSQDNLIVVDPGTSQLAALQSAFSTTPSPAGGIVLSQFFGGQYRGGRSRRRRVTQGA
jgi:hypothetical protein